MGIGTVFQGDLDSVSPNTFEVQFVMFFWFHILCTVGMTYVIWIPRSKKELQPREDMSVSHAMPSARKLNKFEVRGIAYFSPSPTVA